MEIHAAESKRQWKDVERLIRAYLDDLPFEIDFQDVDSELAELAAEYGPPNGAALLVVDDGGFAVGVVGVRQFDDRSAELKRMYVAPEARGMGTGRVLGAAAVSAARDLGFERLLLDTVATMTAAIATYTALGFVEIAPYRHNPLPDARYFSLDLS
ncbi:MAG: GNAT family N-acetyltransferase [Acidimicrobiales bacterium]